MDKDKNNKININNYNIKMGWILNDLLPYELLDIVFSYLPDMSKLRLNKYFYKKYHSLVIKNIKNNRSETYIRCMIRQDNWFVLKHLIRENYARWELMENYYYQDMDMPNYNSFMKYYCAEHGSKECDNEINEYLKKIKRTKKQLHV